MTISLVGTVVGANATSVTPPTGAVGDLLIVVAYRTGSATAPSLPAGWTVLDNTGGGTNAFRAGWKYATATVDSSGTWTNATQIVLARWSGIDPTTPLGTPIHNAGTGTALTYGAITLTGGAAAVLASYAMAAAATAITTRTGYSRDLAQSSAPMTVAEHLANASGSADSATATGSGQWITMQVEILPPTKTIDTTLTCTGTLTAGATRETLASTTLTCTGTLAAGAIRETLATASLTATGTLAATVVQTELAAAAITCTATITAAASVTAGAKTIAATLTGTGTLLANTTVTTSYVPALVGVESATTAAGSLDSNTTAGQLDSATTVTGMLGT